jgi:dUTP pyrophosphatase
MSEVKVMIINKAKHNFGNPTYADPGSSGMDVRASLDEFEVVRPGYRKLIPTGLFVEIPQGYEIQIRPRSELAAKKGVTVLNTPGTIDASYRGELCIIIQNNGMEDFIIENGDRIAQLVLCEVPKCIWENTDTLDDTERGIGGFGHSGIK